jgi:hypothetical protein
MLQSSSDGCVSDLNDNARVSTPRHRQQDADVELDGLPMTSNAGGFRDEIPTITIPMIVRGNPMSVTGWMLRMVK